MQVRSLDPGSPQGKETATHSSILDWEIPWTESLAGYSQRVTKSWTGPSDSVVAIKQGHVGFLHLFVSPLACFISALVFCVKIFRLPVLCCASLLSRV